VAGRPSQTWSDDGATRAVNLTSIAAVFLTFGVFWGSWSVAAADIERELGISHGLFGLLLSAALAGASVTNAVGGALTERHGIGPLLGLALFAWAAAIAVTLALGSGPFMAVTLVATVTIAGLVDVVMNVAATGALADRPGALVRFHALFNGGAAIGAAITGTSLGLGQSWRWSWVLVAGVAAALALAPGIRRFGVATSLPPAGVPAATSLLAVLRLVHREHLVLVAVAFALGAMVEGGVELWGVLFLRTTLASGLAVGSVSAVIGYTVAAAARVVVGPAAGRHSAARGVTAGASVAAAGLVVLAVVDVPIVAGGGLVVAAGGISMCWPLLLAHASAGRERPAAIVGGVSSIGYLGFVFGPAVVGWISALVGLRAGLLVLAAAAVTVAALPNLRR
jgi:MFS family permease